MTDIPLRQQNKRLGFISDKTINNFINDLNQIIE